MSTSHTGGYCTVRDKLMLSEERAREVCKNLGVGMYLCRNCNTFHTHTKGAPGMKKRVSGAQRTRTSPKKLQSDTDIFEIPTKDYDPNRMVPAIPPADYTGQMRDWLEALRKVVRHWPKGVPMIRAADHARLVSMTEPE